MVVKKITTIILLTILSFIANGQTCGQTAVYQLYAARNTLVGNVSVEQVHRDSLKITYTVDYPWELDAVHVDFQYDDSDFPTTPNGNPKIGQFKIAEDFPIKTNTWTTTIFYPVDTVLIDTVWFATHAVVSNKKSETAWAGDKEWSGPRWGWYFGYCVDKDPLPVKLKYFKTEVINFDVKLIWETTMELNNEGFSIQGSINGVEYEEITFVNGMGTTNQTTNYELTIKHEHTYYRMKQIDYDGQYEYSPISCAGQPVKAEIQGQMLIFDEVKSIQIMSINGTIERFQCLEYSLKNGINIIMVDNRVLKIFVQ